MSRPLDVLAVIPHLRAGGALASYAQAARLARADGIAVRHRVRPLDPAISPLARLALGRAGVSIEADPAPSAEADAIARADVVLFVFWSTPQSLLFLERLAPRAPLVAWVCVAGTTPPQVVPPALVRRADRIAVSCAATLTASPLAGDPAGDRATVIRSIVDAGRAAVPARIAHDGFVVGHIGTLGPGKLHPDFVDLCLSAAIPDARFVVCGTGGGEPALRAAAAARGASDRFDFRGYVADVRDALATFDAFGYPLAPETYAASCLSLQEAMLAGVPPVILRHGGIADMVAHGETGLVVDERDYGPALAHLRADPADRGRLGANAARAAADAFDGLAATRRLHALLADATRNAPGGPSPPAAAGDCAAARRFADGLGSWGEPFRRSLDGDASADAAIAAWPLDWARIEGGLFHHRNAAPDDRCLARWSEIVLAAQRHNHSAPDGRRTSAADSGAPIADRVFGRR